MGTAEPSGSRNMASSSRAGGASSLSQGGAGSSSLGAGGVAFRGNAWHAGGLRSQLVSSQYVLMLIKQTETQHARECLEMARRRADGTLWLNGMLDPQLSLLGLIPCSLLP